MKPEVRSQKSRPGESPEATKFKALKIFLNILSSREFLIWIIGGWTIYYVFSAIWMKEAFAHFSNGLRRNLLIQVPFAVFLISGYLNLLSSAIDVFKKGMGRLLAWIILPAGILIFFTGFFISINARQFEWIVAGEGHDIKPKWSSASYRITNVNSGIKASFLDIDIDTGKGIFKYEPKLTVMDNNLKTYEVGAFPPTKIDDAYYHILNFGLAPGIRLLENDSVKDEGYMPLRILQPGSSDSFEIKPYPYKFLVSLEPEKVIQKGNMKASEFNTKDPLYRVRILDGEKIITEGISKEEIRFNNLTLKFFDPTFWFQLEVVKDPGVPVILSGILMIIIGIILLLLRFLFKIIFRKNIVV